MTSSRGSAARPAPRSQKAAATTEVGTSADAAAGALPAGLADGHASVVASADRVYEAIYAAVVDHRLPPGARLREEELARTFAVSRTLVRQALHRLAQDGVVVLRPNRGAQVPEPTREDGAHVFDARRVVECEVVRRLAGQLAEADLQRLNDLVDAETAATAADDHREAIRLSGAFHRELARLTGNPIFVRMLDELLPSTSRPASRCAWSTAIVRCSTCWVPRRHAPRPRCGGIWTSWKSPCGRRRPGDRRRCAMCSGVIARGDRRAEGPEGRWALQRAADGATLRVWCPTASPP